MVTNENFKYKAGYQTYERNRGVISHKFTLTSFSREDSPEKGSFQGYITNKGIL
jgi:hypothetical protein